MYIFIKYLEEKFDHKLGNFIPTGKPFLFIIFGNDEKFLIFNAWCI